MQPEELVRTILTYQGEDIGFRADRVIIVGKNGPSTREYLLHPGGVVIIPVLDSGHVIFVKQYRYGVREYTIELPAGKLEKTDVDLEAAARRELAEETGYQAKFLKKVISIYPTPAFSTEVLHLFKATGLTKGFQQLDNDETVELLILSPSEAQELLRSLPNVDAKTLLGLLLI